MEWGIPLLKQNGINISITNARIQIINSYIQIIYSHQPLTQNSSLNQLTYQPSPSFGSPGPIRRPSTDRPSEWPILGQHHWP